MVVVCVLVCVDVLCWLYVVGCDVVLLVFVLCCVCLVWVCVVVCFWRLC